MAHPARFAAPVLLLLAACGSSRKDPDPWPAASPPLEETVGWLDDRPLTYGEVARYLRTKDAESFHRALDGLVMEKLTLAEAEPLGIHVPRGAIIRGTELRMKEWRQRVRAASKEQTGEEVDPALWLERVAGVSEAELRGWVEHHTRVELLQDRLLRYEQLASPRLDVSILVVKDGALAEKVAAEARGGRSFAELARKHSIDPSAKEGGEIPFPLLKGDVVRADVRAALFQAKAGDLVGPFATQVEKETFHELYRVRARHDGAPGTYGDLARDVDRSLEARPIDVAEYRAWRRRIFLRHGFVAARQPAKTDDSTP